MLHLNEESAIMLACRLATSNTLDPEHGSKMLSMSTKTLQQVVKTTYSKTKGRPGRSGYPSEVKQSAVNKWRGSAITMSALAKEYEVSPVTVKRWITETNTVKLPQFDTGVHRPGRSGHPKDTRLNAINQWRTTANSMVTVAKNFKVTPATIKRWITEADAVKIPQYRQQFTSEKGDTT